MRKTVSIIKEKRHGETRTVFTPVQIKLFCDAGYEVFVEMGLGAGVNIPDIEYKKSGARIVNTEKAWNASNFVIKYKPPIEAEFKYLNEKKIICAVFHAEGNPKLIKDLLACKCTAYSYEFFRTQEGIFPLSVASSEIAGKVAVIYGAYHLQTHLGGSGVLLAPVVNVVPTKVLVIGHGNAGGAAARMAAAIGAQVTVLGINREKLRTFQATMPAGTCCLINTPVVLEKELMNADLVIGAILISTFDTPPMITLKMLRKMKKGSMIIDVTAGYGTGYLPTCDKTSTLQHPVYIKNGVLHCKIDVLPLAYPSTTVEAMSRHLAPYLLDLGESVYLNSPNPTSLAGKIVEKGKIVHPELLRHFQFFQNKKNGDNKL